MPYYQNTASGDTGYLDPNNYQWELTPGSKNLPVQYRDFTEADLARSAGGHFGILSGEFTPDQIGGPGWMGNPQGTLSFTKDPAVGYIVPRINGMSLLDYKQSHNQPTGIVNPAASGAGGGAGPGGGVAWPNGRPPVLPDGGNYDDPNTMSLDASRSLLFGGNTTNYGPNAPADPFTNGVVAKFLERTAAQNQQANTAAVREMVKKVLLAGQQQKTPVSPHLIRAAMAARGRAQ